MKLMHHSVCRTNQWLIGIFVVVAGFLPMQLQAAQLYFSPKTGTFQPGETISVELRVDNQGECINAADISIGFSKDQVEIVDISRGDSIFSIWITPPVVRQEFGLINMVGGIPGGYCGRIPGDPSVTNVIATVIMRFKNSIKTLPVSTKLTLLKTTRVILHDGLGTDAKTILSGAEFSINRTGQPQQNTWTQAIQQDKIPPEAFSVEVHRDKAIFNGKYFAIFSTVDKQTGLDRFEVAELRSSLERGSEKWRRADSPYVLTDQSMRSIIRVKAVDKAGNERVAEYRAPARSETETEGQGQFWALASIAIVFVVIMRLIRFLPL
jgi:hypothetical protein